MKRQRERRFIFENHATGFTSQISSPRHEQLSVQGAAALPMGGGVSKQRLEDVRFAEIASAAEIAVLAEGDIVRKKAGDRNPMTAYRSASSSLRDFDLLATVCAERIVGRIAGSQSELEAEPEYTMYGSGYHGLRIGGREVEIVYQECLFELKRFSGLKDNRAALDLLKRQYVADRKAIGGKAKLPPDAGKAFEALRTGGPIVTSIVAEIRGLPPGVESNGNQVYLPGFGNLFLGELVITPSSRRLTMLRFELGCPYDGCGSGGDVCDDGAWYP